MLRSMLDRLAHRVGAEQQPAEADELEKDQALDRVRQNAPAARDTQRPAPLRDQTS